MYDEIGVHFSRTRSKKYGSESLNWPIIDNFLSLIPPGSKVLDIGCGNGRLVSGLPSTISYFGFDFSRTLVSEAKKTYPKRKFVVGDATDHKFWRGLEMYDAIFSVAVLHHIPTREEQLAILKNAKRHANKKARFVLTTWNLWQVRHLTNHIHSLRLKKENFRWLEIPYNRDWKRFCVAIDKPYLVKLLTDAGWKVEDVFYVDREGKRSDMLRGHNLVAVATA
jgi:SAM-dependent methyltransferase